MLPSGTLLGQLEIVEVYETHDVPRLFTAVNNTGQQYLALWTDYDEDTETWFYVPVSAARLRLIRHGEIDVRDAFKASELDYVYIARIDFASSQWLVELVAASALDDQRLPEPGERIRVSDDAPLDVRSSNLAELAIGTRRDVIGVALYYKRNFGHEAPVRGVGQFLEALQDQVDVFGQERRGSFGPGGAVSPEIFQQTQLVMESTYPSSFGMRLVASLPPDLAGESLAALAIERLMQIMAMDDTQLPGFLKGTHPRVAAKYRKLLISLLDNEAGLSIAWQRPARVNVVRAALTYDRVRQAYEIVSAIEDEGVQVLNVRGILTGANTRTHSFEITTTDGKKRYAGKVLPSAMGQASSATLSKLYDAVIHMSLEVATATGAAKAYYFLADLKDAQG